MLEKILEIKNSLTGIYLFTQFWLVIILILIMLIVLTVMHVTCLHLFNMIKIYLKPAPV